MRRCESSNRKSRGNVERWHPGQLSQRWLRITIVFRNGIAPCKDYCTGGRKVSSAKLFDQFQGCSGENWIYCLGGGGSFLTNHVLKSIITLGLEEFSTLETARLLILFPS